MREVGIIPIKSMTDYKGKSAHYYMLNEDIVELLEEDTPKGKRFTLERINLPTLEDKGLANILQSELEVNNVSTFLNRDIASEIPFNRNFIAKDHTIVINPKLEVYVMEMIPLPTLIFTLKGEELDEREG